MRIASILLTVLLFAVPAFGQTYVSEYETITAQGYHTISGGQNYEVSPGVFAPSNKGVKSNAQYFYADEVALAWELRKNSGDITYTRDGVQTTFGFDGVYWVDAVNHVWTPINTSSSPSPVQVGDTVVMADIYTGIDAVIISNQYGIDVQYTIKDRTGWPANPYGANGYLGFYHEMKTRGHSVKTSDGQTWNNGFKTSKDLHFHGGNKQFDIVETEATDANGDTEVVLNILFDGAGKDFFGEGLRADWLDAATLPVVMNYESKTGFITSNQTWSAGNTYLVYGTCWVGGSTGVTLTIQGGAFVKMGGASTLLKTYPGNGIINVEGTMETPAWFTSCKYDIPDESDEDTSGDANCTGTATPGHHNGVDLDGDANNVGHSWVGFRWMHGGVSNYNITGSSGRKLDQFVMSDSNCPTVNVLIPTADHATTNNSVTNGVILLNSGDNCDAIQINASTCDATTTYNINNNLVITTDATNATNGILLNSYAASGCAGVEIRNNTIIGNNTDPNIGIGITTSEDTANIVATDNIVYDADLTCYSFGAAYSNVVATHNTAFSCTTDFDANWGKDATEDTRDPNFTTGTGHTDYEPSATDAYHLNAASSEIDDGSRTASAASLDSFHTVAAGTADSGTVDRGYHFQSEAAPPPAEEEAAPAVLPPVINPLTGKGIRPWEI